MEPLGPSWSIRLSAAWFIRISERCRKRLPNHRASSICSSLSPRCLQTSANNLKSSVWEHLPHTSHGKASLTESFARNATIVLLYSAVLSSRLCYVIIRFITGETKHGG